MFNEDVVKEIAAGLNRQMESALLSPAHAKGFYIACVRDMTTEMANIINKFNPEINLNMFYRAAGYTGTLPVYN